MKFATILQNMDEHEIANWLCDSNFEFAKHFITTVFKEFKIKLLNNIIDLIQYKAIKVQLYINEINNKINLTRAINSG